MKLRFLCSPNTWRYAPSATQKFAYHFIKEMTRFPFAPFLEAKIDYDPAMQILILAAFFNYRDEGVNYQHLTQQEITDEIIRDEMTNLSLEGAPYETTPLAQHMAERMTVGIALGKS